MSSVTEQRWWVVAPRAHRQQDIDEYRRIKASGEPEMQEFMGEMVSVIRPEPPAVDDWGCDWCGDNIDVGTVDQEQPVPMVDNNALCSTCKSRHLKGLDALKPWSNQCCGCEPCAETMKALHRASIQRFGPR